MGSSLNAPETVERVGLVTIVNGQVAFDRGQALHDGSNHADSGRRWSVLVLQSRLSIDPLALQLLDELNAIAGRRKRLLAVECDDALLEVAAQLRADPDRRRRLLELLTVLRENALLEWSAARDRSVLPALPSFVVVKAATARTPLTDSIPGVPWRPELEWIYDLRITAAEHETMVTVNAYRRDRKPTQEPIPHRERSLQLFGDEKRIDRLVRSAAKRRCRSALASSRRPATTAGWPDSAVVRRVDSSARPASTTCGTLDRSTGCHSSSAAPGAASGVSW